MFIFLKHDKQWIIFLCLLNNHSQHCVKIKKNAETSKLYNFNKKVILFKNGVFSQWYICKFKVSSIQFSSAEQFMMYSKAMLFRNSNVAKLILESPSPHDQKALGRQVQNYDENTWRLFREGIVFSGNYAKFTQNEELKEALINTGDTIIAEASIKDKLWGVGLSEDDPKAQNIHLWKGQNLLGLALMKVRAIVRDT